MSLIDIAILGLVLASGYVSYQRGAIQQLSSGLGLIIGLSLGSRLSLFLLQYSHNSGVRTAVAVLITGLASVVLLQVGKTVGVRYRTRILTTRAFKPDKYTGIVVGVFGATLLCWLGASVLLSAHSANTENTILGSKIVKLINRQSYFGKSSYDVFYLISPDHDLNIGQLRTGAGQPPPYDITVGTAFMGIFAKAVTKDYPSVVHVTRQGCYLSNSYGTGSGYIAAPDMVVTAAHVVAGSSSVSVEDTRKNSYIGNVINYDVKHDMALIYVSGLPDPPLQLDDRVHTVGEPVAILGFPGTLPFEANSGNIQTYGSYSVLGVQAPTLNAGKGATFYQTSAAAFPGDSGGPLITQSGAVIGHFTIYQTNNPSYVTSDDNPADIASTFSVALKDYQREIQNSEKSPQRVSTGYCPD